MDNSMKKVGAGILGMLEEMEEVNEAGNKGLTEEEIRAIKEQILKEVKEEVSKGITEQEEKNKGTKEPKTKRSYMLKDTQIEMVYLLKSKFPSKDHGQIVGEAIEEYFEKYYKE